MRRWFVVSLLVLMAPLFAEYSAVFESTLDFMQIGTSTSLYEGGYFSVRNTGDPDTFTLNTVTTCISDDPFVMFCDDQGMCYPGSYQFNLANGESKSFHANVIPGNFIGQIDYRFDLISTHITEPIALPFRYLTNDCGFLLIDDDGGADLSYYYTSALDGCGLSHGVWDNSRTPVTDEAVNTFPNCIWSTGTSYPPLDSNDRAKITAMINRHDAFILTGQRIASSLNAGTAEEIAFLHDVLQTNFVAEDSGINHILGVFDNPFEGQDYTINGGDGADNQVYRNVIESVNAGDALLLEYEGGQGAARGFMPDGQGHVLFMGFGFEAINVATDRSLFLRTILAAAGLDVANGDVTTPQQSPVKLTNYPNPFNPTTTIAWSLSDPKRPVDLTIYNLKGQMVRSETGLTGNTFTWNGTNDHGQTVTSGVYFYKIQNGVETSTKKMIMLK